MTFAYHVTHLWSIYLSEDSAAEIFISGILKGVVYARIKFMHICKLSTCAGIFTSNSRVGQRVRLNWGFVEDCIDRASGTMKITVQRLIVEPKPNSLVRSPLALKEERRKRERERGRGKRQVATPSNNYYGSIVCFGRCILQFGIANSFGNSFKLHHGARWS